MTKLDIFFFFNLEIMTRIIKWNETLCMWMDIIKSIQCIPPSPICIYDGATHVSMDSRWKCIYHFLQFFYHLSVLILSSAYHCLPSFTHISDMKMAMGPFWCVSDFIHTYIQHAQLHMKVMMMSFPYLYLLSQSHSVMILDVKLPWM